MTKKTTEQLDREIAEAMGAVGSATALADRFIGAVTLGTESEARLAHTRRALEVILHGKLDGMIHGSEYKDAKDHLSRRFEEAYEAKIRSPYFHGKGYTPDSEWEGSLGSTYGLHSAISVAKRLAKAPPAPNPALDRDLRAFFAATQPIAVIVAELKFKIVKGRKPNPDTVAKKAAVAASRVGRDGECQICQHRQILSSKGTLVLHGYERPGNGYILGDCFGTGRKPWEVACDALAEWIEKLKRASAENARAAIAVAAFTTVNVNRGSTRKPRMVTLVKGGIDPDGMMYGHDSFASEIRMRVRGHELQAESLAEEAKREAARLKTWKPAKTKEGQS